MVSGTGFSLGHRHAPGCWRCTNAKSPGQDDLVFDLFEIRASREEVRRFYETVGRVTQEEPEADQAASE